MMHFLRRLSGQISQDRKDDRHSRQHGLVVALIERDINGTLPERLIAPKR